MRVLLAEDHEGVAAQLCRLLETEFSVVGVVAEGESLVSAVDALHPEVIVSDVGMPGVDGLTAASLILARDPGARIVFVTVHDDPGLVREALRIGALGYVLKVDAGEELIPAVHAAHAGRSHVSAGARTRSIRKAVGP